MKFLCHLGWHNWTMWGERFEEKWENRSTVNGEVKIFEYVRNFQVRRCQDCRLMDKKEVRREML